MLPFPDHILRNILQAYTMSRAISAKYIILYIRRAEKVEVMRQQ